MSIGKVQDAGVGSDIHHFDVMDGHFVPNLSFGLPVLQELKKMTSKPVDVHLMVSNPDEVAGKYASSGADSISFHLEAARSPLSLLQQLKSEGITVGVALKPTTPVDALVPLLPELDYVLMMSVHPGFSGQSFLPNSLARIREVYELWSRNREQDEPLIQVDGGINADNIASIKGAGASSFVVGSSFYKSSDRAKIMAFLKAAILSS